MKKFYPAFLLFIFSLIKVFAQAPVISYPSPQAYAVNAAIMPLMPASTGGAVPSTVFLQAFTLAGSGTAGNTNGIGTGASFKSPYGTATDASGNIYLADAGNNLIRKITPTGVVSTFAGSGSYGSVNGMGTAATFSSPRGVAVDASGNVYVADQGSNKIRKITSAGIVSTLAGSGAAGAVNGTGTAATFNSPYGVAVDNSGNIYIADYTNNLIREVTPAGLVSTLAGSGAAGATNGTGTAASFKTPRSLAVDASGNVYVADYGNNLIRKITPAGVVTTLAGSGAAGHIDGTGTAATFDLPSAITIDASGDLYVSDLVYNLIRKVNLSGSVRTIAGTGSVGSNNGIGTGSSFNGPNGISIDTNGNLYISDSGNQLIRKIILTGYTISGILPSGLSFAPTTGVISGTPTTAGITINYTVTAYNGSGSDTANVSIAIVNPALAAPYVMYSGPQVYTPGTAITPLSPANTGGAVPAAFYLRTSTLAGSGMAGNANATGTAASFKNPYGTATDASGNIYVADAGNNLIRKITPAGVVTTFAGSGAYGSVNGTGTGATFSSPRSVAVDAAGNVYVADQGSNKIRKVTSAGVVSTIAGTGAAGAANGTGTAATFSSPYGVAVDISGNVYVADYTNNLIREINSAGVVITLAGSGTAGATNGTGASASFKMPRGVAVDVLGNVYVADYGNSLIRKITSAGVVTTLAGSGAIGHTDGAGTSASFDLPTGVTIDVAGNVYVSDLAYNLIRKITPTGVVTTIAGTGSLGAVNGTGTAASFNGPNGVAVDANDNLYIGDSSNQLIRKITLGGYTISPALSSGLAFDPATGTVSGTPVSVSTSIGYSITAYNAGGIGIANLNISVDNPPAALHPPIISYPSPQSYNAGTAISPLVPANTGGSVPATVFLQASTLAGSGTSGNANGTGTGASFKSPFGMATDASGNIYVADAGNNLIRKITQAGVVTTFAGSGVYGSANGTGTAASFSSPRGVAVDAAGNVYVADQGSNKIRMITSAGVVTTLAGSGAAGAANGTGTAASFNSPYGVAVDISGNVYVADFGNNQIRAITSNAVVTTLAGSGTAGAANGTGTAASFKSPRSVTTDASGNVYVADYANNLIRKITPAGVVSTLAGSGTAGHADGTGTAASFDLPTGITADAAGNLYVCELVYNLVRKIYSNGTVRTIAGTGSAGSNNGTATGSSFNSPNGIATDVNGNLYIGDSGNQLIRRVIATGYTMSPTLPAGLTFDPTTGTISGTPTTVGGAVNYTITAYNGNGSGTAAVSITINNKPAPLTTPQISYAGPKTYAINKAITALSPTNAGGAVPKNVYGQVTTIAGSTNAGAQNGTGSQATFDYIAGMTTDASGNVYAADNNNNLIREITPKGVVTTFAGSGDAGATNGTGTAATFSNPVDVARDPSGNIYVADGNNNLIRKVTPGGVVSTFAGNSNLGFANGTGTQAGFTEIDGIAADTLGNIYVADVGDNMVRKITPAGVVTTFAGNSAPGFANGTGTAARFNDMYGITTDPSGNVYVADVGNNMIRKITPAAVVTTFAGNGTYGSVNGPGSSAEFSYPFAVRSDPLGNLYEVDFNSPIIRKITSDGFVSTLAGNSQFDSVDGIGTAASFGTIGGLATDSFGNLYVGDSGYLRVVTLTGYTIDQALPAGLNFDPTTGIISGTPTAASPATVYTISAYNIAGNSSATISITVTGGGPSSVDKQTLAVANNVADVISPPEPIVRQAVSPNGDGINDVLVIDGIENYSDNRVTLIDRTGKPVFEIVGYDNVNKVFDGHSNISRLKQQAGTYFYLLEYHNANGDVKRKTGYFILKYQ